jgi:hypothetical protein
VLDPITRIVLIGVCATLIFAKAQELESQPLPEPEIIYTCGENYQPVALVFDGEGNLYSTDAQLLSWMSEYALATDYQIESNGKVPSSYVYENTSRNACNVVREALWGIYGITTRPNGAICFTLGQGAINLLANDNERFLECFIKGKAEKKYSLKPLPYINSPFLLESDLSSCGNDICFISVQSNPADSSGMLTRVSLTDTELRVESETTIPFIPKFIYVSKSEDVFLSVFPNSVSGLVLPDGDRVMLPTVLKTKMGSVSSQITTFSYVNADPLLNFPTGIWSNEQVLLVSDFSLGQLRIYTLNKELKQIYTGLQGPMGIAQAPNGDLCIAEMRGARISCYSLASLGLE